MPSLGHRASVGNGMGMSGSSSGLAVVDPVTESSQCSWSRQWSGKKIELEWRVQLMGESRLLGHRVSLYSTIYRLMNLGEDVIVTGRSCWSLSGLECFCMAGSGGLQVSYREMGRWG